MCVPKDASESKRDARNAFHIQRSSEKNEVLDREYVGSAGVTASTLPFRCALTERMITQVLPCPKILYVNADDFPMTRNMDTFTRNAIKPVKNIND
mmetsp:Transcript_10651/g.44404  ORF Transcript_10651/g.44404 Transcript_10651/m.44404 type:complete len:96 (+) Transcript_10651:543-830(+)